jgi:hypothetical protein
MMELDKMKVTIRKFYVETAMRRRHCNCGCGQSIHKGERVIVFKGHQRQGNLKINCAMTLIKVG